MAAVSRRSPSSVPTVDAAGGVVAGTATARTRSGSVATGRTAISIPDANRQAAATAAATGEPQTVRGRTYTGATAITRAEGLTRQYNLPAEATAVIEEYRRRTGGYPNLAQLVGMPGAAGGAGGYGQDTAEGTTQLGLLGGGLNTWLLLSAAGVVLVLMFGSKKRG